MPIRARPNIRQPIALEDGHEVAVCDPTSFWPNWLHHGTERNDELAIIQVDGIGSPVLWARAVRILERLEDLIASVEPFALAHAPNMPGYRQRSE